MGRVEQAAAIVVLLLFVDRRPGLDALGDQLLLLKVVVTTAAEDEQRLDGLVGIGIGGADEGGEGDRGCDQREQDTAGNRSHIGGSSGGKRPRSRSAKVGTSVGLRA